MLVNDVPAVAGGSPGKPGGSREPLGPNNIFLYYKINIFSKIMLILASVNLVNV